MSIDQVRGIASELLGESSGEKTYSLDTVEEQFLAALDLELADHGLTRGEGYSWRGMIAQVELFKQFHAATGRKLFDRLRIYAGENDHDERLVFPNAAVDQKFYRDHLQVMKDYIVQSIVGNEIGESVDVLGEEKKYRLGTDWAFIKVGKVYGLQHGKAMYRVAPEKDWWRLDVKHGQFPWEAVTSTHYKRPEDAAKELAKIFKKKDWDSRMKGMQSDLYKKDPKFWAKPESTEAVRSMRDELLECGCGEEELDEAKPGGVVDNVRQIKKMIKAGASDKEILVALQKRGSTPRQAAVYLKRVRLQYEDVELQEEFLGEASEARLNFGDEVDQNRKQKDGNGIKITPAVHAWFEKKFAGKAKSYTLTNQGKAISSQTMTLSKAKGRMGSVQIVATPFGDYLRVVSSDGVKTKKQYFKFPPKMTEDVDLQEDAYLQAQFKKLNGGDSLRVQVQDDSGGKTKWMTIDKEVIDAVKSAVSGRPGKRTYASSQISLLKKGDTLRIQVQDDSGGKTHWLNLSKDLAKAMGSLKSQREDVELDEACKDPGKKRRSKGKGRGLGVGDGKGPLGTRKLRDDVLGVKAEDVELDEAKKSFVVQGVATYQRGKWKGTEPLPTKEIAASSESDAKRKAEKIYKGWMKSNSKIPKEAAGSIKLNLSIAQAEDVEDLDEAKRYYLLVGKQSAKSPFEVIFGDYSRETVEDEKDDEGGSWKKVKIVTAPNSSQKTINAIVKKMNESVGGGMSDLRDDLLGEATPRTGDKVDNPDSLWHGAEYISTHSRKDALRGGDLHDVTKYAKENGFKFPTAVTRSLWKVLSKIPRGSGNDINGRMADLFSMMKFSMRRASGDTLKFKMTIGRKVHHLMSKVGPGDDPRPVMTIGYPQDF